MEPTPRDAPAVTWTDGWVARPGFDLHYMRAGKGPTLLLLHGVTDSAAYWSGTARSLAHAYDVIALDQRGHGQSGAPEAGYRIADYVADALAMLVAIASPPCIVMGHSFGAWVGTRLAAVHPQWVSRLILEDPPFRAPSVVTEAQADAARWEWFAGLRENQQLDRDERLRKCRRLHPAWSEADCAAWADSRPQVKPRVWEAGGIEWDRAWPEAALAVQCPTLVLHGDAALGSIVDEQIAAGLRATMRDCRTVHISGTGHQIHMDQPKALLAAVLDFLAPSGA